MTDGFSNVDGPAVAPLKWDGAAETVPDGWVVESDGNGRRESPVLTCLRNMGPSPAKEIADVLGRETGNVGTQLRQMEEAGRVRRTGRSVNVPGQRGGPQVEWDLMGVDGEPTGPGDEPVSPGEPAGFAERMRAMAERIGAANARVEALESERDAARERADAADREVREMKPRFDEARRSVQRLEERVSELEGEQDEDLKAEVKALRAQIAERAHDARLATVTQRGASQQDLEKAQARVRELERAREELEAIAAERLSRITDLEQESAGTEALGRIRTLLEVGAGEDVVESVEALVEQVEQTSDLHGQVAEARRLAGDLEKDRNALLEGDAGQRTRIASLERERDDAVARFETQRRETEAVLEELEEVRGLLAERGDALDEMALRAAPAVDGRGEMLRRYFDELLELVRRGSADEHVMDRIERLIEPPAHD